MQQRPVVTVVAIIAAVALGGLALFALLNRGPDTGSLTGRTWQLAALAGETPAFRAVVPAEEQSRYTIDFAADGTFAALADCNTVSGTYELRGNDGMTLTLGASTLVACPDGSYGTIFAHELANVTTWAIANRELTLTTTDGGVGTFVEGSGIVASPSPSESPSESPSDSPSPSPSPTASPSPSPSPTPSPSPRRARRPQLHRPRQPHRPRARPRRQRRLRPRPRRRHPPKLRPRRRLLHRRRPPPRRRRRRHRRVATWSARPGSSRPSPHATQSTRASIPVDQRSKYTISFAADGTFSAAADCNTSSANGPRRPRAA